MAGSKKRIAAKTGGDWFVRILKEKGVQFVFGTTGSGMVEIQDAMVLVKPPKWIQGLHEFTAVSAATGYALASGAPGVALVDRVVGTQNMIGALYCSYLTTAPTVVFASRDLPGVRSPDGFAPFHYNSSQAQMVKPWVKWFTELSSVETLPYDVERAFQVAMAEPRGATFVTLPHGPMASRVSKATAILSGSEHVALRVPDDRTLERIVEEILSHSNPQVLVANAGRRVEAVGALVDFAELLGIGVRDRRTFMSFPVGHKLHCGFAAWGPAVLPDTDLAMALEAGMLPHEQFGEGVELIDLASDPVHMQDVPVGGDYGGTPIPALIRAQCDVAPTLRKLSKLAAGRITEEDRARIGDRAARIAEYHDDIFGRARESARESVREGILELSTIGYVLNNNWSSNMTWVDGCWKERLYMTVELNEPGTYFCNPSGHLGVAVGMAYGAALARRRYADVRTTKGYASGRITKSPHAVICTTGDGDAIQGNLDSALWTCKHYGIGVLYVILNNACWGVEWFFFEHSTMKWALKAKDYEFVDIDQPRVDFCGIAKAFGVKAERVETPKQLDRALKRAIPLVRQGEPVLLDLWMEKETGSAKSPVP